MSNDIHSLEERFRREQHEEMKRGVEQLIAIRQAIGAKTYSEDEIRHDIDQIIESHRAAIAKAEKGAQA